MQDPDEQAVELWRKVAQANPGDSHTLSMLAFIEAESADQSNPDIPLVLARRGTAWRHLQAARRINNELALTYAAEAVLLPRWRYDERFAVLDHGQKLDPGSAILYWVRSQTQADVGRLDGGVASARRAVEIDPGSVLYRGQLIMALMYGGYAGSAAAELKEAERIWPASLTTNEMRARFDLRFGDPKELLRKLESGITIPNMSGRWASRFAYNFLLARAQPTPEHAEAAIRDVLRASEEEVWPRVLNLADLGAVDQAYKLLQNPARLRELRHNGSDILFRADTRSLRLDRRFMQLADKLGLANFWQSNDYWPDFCYDKDLPYDCKTEARRLRARPS
jgi:tetratricopeptide (TPR) repeat protein